jgi:G protein-coupled receptor kinase interacting protein 2
MYEARQMSKDDNNRPPVTQSLYSIATNPSQATASATQLPLFEEVKKRTDMVARRIKELYTAMQDLAKKEAFVPCAERIRVAVAELLAIFPPNVAEEPVRNALKQINFNTNLIQTDCTRLQRALTGQSEEAGSSSMDAVNSIEYYIKKVRDCAYDLAMSTKVLITHFEGQE